MNIVITGASSGIGRSLAKVCAEHGHSLLLVARRAPELLEICEELSQQHGIKADYVALDLTESNAPLVLMDALHAKNFQVDCLINNAGLGYMGRFEAMQSADIHQMIALNINALSLLTHEFVQYFLKQKHGQIMQVASVAGFLPGPYMSLYYATKAFVIRLSQALAYELKDKNIHISILAPGPTATGFLKRAHMDGSKIAGGFMGMMSADKVAEVAYQGMMKRKKMIIPGLINKILAWSTKITPASLGMRIVAMIHKHD